MNKSVKRQADANFARRFQKFRLIFIQDAITVHPYSQLLSD